MVYDRWAERQGDNVEFKKRLGVLMATGLIVGESLFGVVFAGIVAASGSDAPLAVVGEGFKTVGTVIGVVLFAATALALYQWTRRAACADAESAPAVAEAVGDRVADLPQRPLLLGGQHVEQVRAHLLDVPARRRVEPVEARRR